MSAYENLGEEIAKALFSFIETGRTPDITPLIIVARTAAAETERAQRERDENNQMQTRLLREIVELLARPDGIGGQRAVQRVRRRVRKTKKE